MNYNFEFSQILVSLAIIAAIWFGLFGYLRRDGFRSRIRNLRDDLFDFMWQNGHSFETPAYQETRQSLNGILRISNRLGPVSFIIFLAFCSEYDDGQKCELDDVKPESLKRKIQETHNRAVRELLLFVYLGGIFGLFMKLLLAILKMAQYASSAKRWALRTAEHFVITVAYPVGRPDWATTQS